MRREQIHDHFESVPRKVLPLEAILCEQALLLEEGLGQSSARAWPSVPVKYGGLRAGDRPSFDIHRLQPMLGKSFTLQHPGSSGCPYYSHSRTLPSFCVLVYVVCERTITNMKCLSSLAAFRAVDDCDCARLEMLFIILKVIGFGWITRLYFQFIGLPLDKRQKNKPKTLESGISQNSVSCQLTLTFNYWLRYWEIKMNNWASI